MLTRRLIAAGLSLAAALALSATGCATGDSGDAIFLAPSPTADPKVKLSSASSKLEGTSYRMKMTIGSEGTLTSTVDPAAKACAMTMSMKAEDFAMKIDARVIDADIFMKMDLGIDLPGLNAAKWMHVDAARMPAGNALGLEKGELDPSNAEDFLKLADGVEEVGDGTFKGTLNLTEMRRRGRRRSARTSTSWASRPARSRSWSPWTPRAGSARC